MREIKFRAWDKELEKMCEDFLSLVEEAIYQHQANPWQDERFIPMQFTGLKDKNGKEIYEGDIGLIFYDDEEGLQSFTVVYDEGDAGFVFQSRSHNINLSVGLFCNDANVTGNIYENPELLK